MLVLGVGVLECGGMKSKAVVLWVFVLVCLWVAVSRYIGLILRTGNVVSGVRPSRSSVVVGEGGQECC